MNWLFTWFTRLFGSVCILIALGHIAIGPDIIPGGVSVNATMDSEDRFYASLFLGFGGAVIWTSFNFSDRGNLFLALMGIFFLGGLARIVSIISVGWPTPLFIFLGALELLIPPVCWWLLKTTTKNDTFN